MKTTREMIEVMEAFESGKAVEIQFKGVDVWEDCPAPRWDWNICDYRIKPRTTKHILNVR